MNDVVTGDIPGPDRLTPSGLLMIYCADTVFCPPITVHSAFDEKVVFGFVRAVIDEFPVLNIPPKLELTVIVNDCAPEGVTPVNAAE